MTSKPYYTELEYLESTGTQYIDTGINGSGELSVEIKAINNNADNSKLFGYRTDTTTNRNIILNSLTSNKNPRCMYYLDYGSGEQINSNIVGNDNIHIFKLDKNIASIDGTVTNTYTKQTFTGGSTYLFACNQNGTVNGLTRAKVYYCKIWDDGTLVRDFIPVLDFNNIPAMYDKATNTNYYNQGTGSFNYKVKGIKPYFCELEYLESTGTQYIDTGINADTNLGFEFIYALTDLSALDYTRIGVIRTGESSGRWIRHHLTLSSLGQYGNIQYMLDTGISGTGNSYNQDLPKDTNQHVLKLDTVNKIFTYDGVQTSFEINSFDSHLNYYLFGRNNYLEGVSSISYAKMRIYKAKLYSSGTLVRDYIPVLDNDKVPCLYDKVSGQCFYNLGTGEFNYGRKIYPVEYLESSETQYIDTGIDVNENVGIDIKFSFTKETPNITEHLIGAQVLGDVCRYNPIFCSSVSGGSIRTILNITNTESITRPYDTNIHTLQFNIYPDKKCVYDGVDEATVISVGTGPSINVFRRNLADNWDYSSARVYYLKLFDKTELVRDYIPAIDENGVAFMFDNVTHMIYDNAGTGAFIAGPTILEQGRVDLGLKNKLSALFRKRRYYTPLKYLISDGNQWIDTGKTVTNNSIITVAGKITDTTQTDACIWGVGSSGTSADRVQTHFNQSGLSVRIDGTLSSFVSVGENLFVSEVNIPKKKGYINGNEVLSSYSGDIDTTRSITLFKRNIDVVGSVNSPAKCAISSFRHYTSTGDLITDMVPILDRNGVPCMWDRLTNNLFYNEGSGNFTYEEWDYTVVDYIYADGNAYSNPFLYGNSNTKMEVLMEVSVKPTENHGTVGSRGSSANDNLLAVGYGASSLVADFNNSSWSTFRAAITYETNTKYRVYTSKEKRSIIEEDTGTVLAENNTLCTDTLSTNPLLLCAETGIAYNHVGKFYSANYWDGDILMRDFIPVVDENNVAGFYDKCLNTIFYSIGTSPYEAHFVDGNNDYKVVHFLECTTAATQEGPYIDTGVPYFADFEVGAQVRSNVSNKVILSGQYYCLERNNQATGVYRFANGQDYRLVTNALITQYHVIKWKDNKTYIDGVFFSDFNKTAQTGANLTIFGYLNNIQRPSSYPSVVHFVKVWNPSNGELLRHLIPVVKNNVGYMFDVKNRVLYSNAGTGTFVYG